MTDGMPQSDGDLIDAYLDDLLPAPERAAYERRLEREPRLRALLDQQRQIDEALARVFTPGAARERILANVRERSGTEARSSRAVRSTIGRGLAVAAALALSAAAIWFGWNPAERTAQRFPTKPHQNMSLVEIYEYEISTGLEPSWICKDDEEFIEAFRQRYRQPLVLASGQPGIEALGLAYSDAFGRYATMLLARVDQTPVLVFINTAKRDPGRTADPQSHLNVFQRRLGKLVLYEVTPLKEPHLLELFRIPERSAKDG